MRIIGGEYRSRPLKAPRGMTTRPTLDQVREALFNILQGEIEGISVLDLYGGSGAVALEALSRGASRAVICDQSRDALAVIRETSVPWAVPTAPWCCPAGTNSWSAGSARRGNPLT